MGDAVTGVDDGADLRARCPPRSSRRSSDGALISSAEIVNSAMAFRLPPCWVLGSGVRFWSGSLVAAAASREERSVDHLVADGDRRPPSTGSGCSADRNRVVVDAGQHLGELVALASLRGSPRSPARRSRCGGPPPAGPGQHGLVGTFCRAGRRSGQAAVAVGWPRGPGSSPAHQLGAAWRGLGVVPEQSGSAAGARRGCWLNRNSCSSTSSAWLSRSARPAGSAWRRARRRRQDRVPRPPRHRTPRC